MVDYSITSVQNALKILKLFAHVNQPLSLMEICAQTSLNKSTALRMTYTLKEEGFLTVTEDTKKYKLGTSALQIGLSALYSLNLSNVAEPRLKKLADETGFLVQMAIFKSNNAIIIAKIFPLTKVSFNMRLASEVGGMMPTYCTGIGLLFLAHESDEFVREFLNNCSIVSYTSTTETDIEKIIERIRMIRRQRFAINNGEYDEGVVSICYPVYDHTQRMVAGISLSGIREAMNRSDIEKLKSMTLSCTMDISRDLGYMPKSN
ncbi:MAG: IclR family transcriptional regulator [Clostridiaceae bacterium]